MVDPAPSTNQAAPPAVQTNPTGTPAPPTNTGFTNTPFGYVPGTQSASSAGAYGAVNPGSGTIEAPPSAAASSYQYQTYVAGASIVPGATLGNIFGISPTTAIQGDKLMALFMDLPQQDRATVESYLLDAGMYINTAAEPLQGAVNLGARDDEAFMAFSNAILLTADAQQHDPTVTMSGYLSQQINSGAGLATVRKGLQPQFGGANTYQVNLTSPTDMYGVALQTFQQLLGRFPTQSEISEMTKQLQSQETQYQSAINTQQEQMSQAKYQAQIAARTAVNAPNYNSINGQVPNGPFTSPEQWAVALLEFLGVQNINPQAVALLTSWINQNGGLNGKGQFNPLGIQTTAPGANAAPSAAQNYTNWAQGIQAAANMLSSVQYAQLLAALKSSGTTAAGIPGSQNVSQDPVVQQQIAQFSGGAVTSVKPTAAQLRSATAAVSAYTPPVQQVQPITIGPQLPMGISGTNARTLGIDTSSTTVTPQAPVPTSASPTSIAPGQVTPGQGLTSPGDTYVPPTTLTQITPPSASNVATQAATTGANAVPYLGNQFLSAYQTIAGMIHQVSAPL